MKSQSRFVLFLISALNESGGGFLTRLLDGHPELQVYPFEMQLGIQRKPDATRGYCFQARYRWPAGLRAPSKSESFHRAVIDREVKSYLRNRSASKFSKFDLELSQEKWRKTFKLLLNGQGARPTRVGMIEAYLKSFFLCWKNRGRSGKEGAVLGHCPVILFDADRVFTDFPYSKILHLVRHPISTFHDTKSRLPSLPVGEFCRIWNLTAFVSHYWQGKSPERFGVVRYEDLIAHRRETMKKVARFFGIAYSPLLLTPSWNGTRLEKIQPFGGIPQLSTVYEDRARRGESPKTRNLIGQLTLSARKLCGY
jgi:hypothetical protein